MALKREIIDLLGTLKKQVRYRLLKLKNSFKYFKIGWEDGDFDFYYLLVLEKRKMRDMAEYFNKSDLTEDSWYMVRNLRLAVSLLDIIDDTDSSYKVNIVNKDDIELRYVNVRNAMRFVNTGILDSLRRNENLSMPLKDEIRKEKAWKLYCRIREEQLRTWWD